MENHPIQVLCPKRTCRGAVRVGRDGIAQCAVCGTELGVWESRPIWAKRPADPKDWDIQTVSLVSWPRRIGWAAALVLAVSLGVWFGIREDLAAEDSSQPASIALTEGSFLDAFRTGVLPPGLDLPRIYQDPSLIGVLKQDAFVSPSPLVKMWLQSDVYLKGQVLNYVVQDGQPSWLLAFLAEIAYSAIALESDRGIASLIRSAVHSTAVTFAPVSIFLLDHIEQVCPHDVVRQDAADDARDLRSRIGALGH